MTPATPEDLRVPGLGLLDRVRSSAWVAGREVVAKFADSVALVDEARFDIDRFVDEVTDIPSTCAAVRRLVDGLETAQRDPDSWVTVLAALRSGEPGRLLRTDPMVRRCQWRAANADAYDIVEAFVMGWGDAPDALGESEQPGQTVNATFLSMGMAAAIRERRSMVHGFLAGVPGRPHVLGLGTGRTPELALLAPTGTINAARWVIIDEDASEDAVRSRAVSPCVERRRAALPGALAEAAANGESFDVVYAVGALDAMTETEARDTIDLATRLLGPNGRLIVSAFASDLPEAAYLAGALDWRPRLRDELMLAELLAGAADDGPLARTVWRGGSNRVVFGVIERQSWAG